MLQQQNVDVDIHTIIPHRKYIGSDYSHAVSEHMVVCEDVVQTLTSGGTTKAVQVFRASATNVHDIALCLKGVTSGDSNFEDFESYADTAALKAEWVPDDATNTDVVLETTIVHSGSQAMKYECSANKSVGDTITRTISSADWTGYDTITFWSRMHRAECIWRLHVGDGTNDKYYEFHSSQANVYEEHVLNFEDFTDSGGTTPDMSAVTKVWLEMVDCPSSGWNYIDDFVLSSAASVGTATVALHDFGATADPSTLTSAMTLDDGTTGKTFDLGDVKGHYSLHFHYDVHADKTDLTIGNYYGLSITYNGGASVEIYGSDSDNLYSSGQCYTVSGSTMTTCGANKDFFFVVNANVDTYLENVVIQADADPGKSVYDLWIQDGSGNIIDYLVKSGTLSSTEPYKVIFDTLRLGAGYKIVLGWDDASDSSATTISVAKFLTHDPIDTYG